MGLMDNALIWAVGLLVVATIAIAAVLPGVLNVISGSDVIGTSTGEIWVGTAATAHAMNYKPIVSTTGLVTTFAKSTNATTAINTTRTTGNRTHNTTTLYTFSFTNGTGFDNGAITGATCGLNYTVQFGDGDTNVSVKFAGYIGKVATNATWFVDGYTCTNPTVVNFTFNGTSENVSTVSNVSMRYSYFNTSTAYTLTDKNAGTITPTATGGYYTTYSYGTTGTASMKLVLDLVPLMIGVVLLLIVLTSATWMQG